MDVTKLGKYDIVRELGRGAMGVVYEGVDPHIGRKVAIKTIRFDVLTAPAEQQEAQQRFMREARSAGNLSHPSIVTIYEVGEHDGLSFIAMEFIDGESLESMIAARRRLPLEGVIELIAQLGDALDYAHRNGVIHRDIKPANILVDREGRPRIVDFGIARIASSSLTQTATVLGTPSYMAPEQIAGQKIDHRVDLFALGAILYELLTFQRAFPGDNVTTVIYKIMNVTPPPPRDFDQSLSSGLDAVLGVALAKDPAGRYQSGRALAEDLRNYQQFEDGAAQATAQIMVAAVVPPAIPAAQAGAPSRGRRTMLLAVVGAMITVLVIAVVAGVLLSRKSEPYSAGAGGAAGEAAPSDAPPCRHPRQAQVQRLRPRFRHRRPPYRQRPNRPHPRQSLRPRPRGRESRRSPPRQRASPRHHDRWRPKPRYRPRIGPARLRLRSAGCMKRLMSTNDRAYSNRWLRCIRQKLHGSSCRTSSSSRRWWAQRVASRMCRF
jgi:serine/threonine-protein kinase